MVFFQCLSQEKIIKFEKGFTTPTNNLEQYQFNTENAYYNGFYYRFITFNKIPNQEKLDLIKNKGIG